MISDDPRKAPFVFGASALATTLGLVIVFDPSMVADPLGWDELSATNVYVRGLLLTFAGCWFGQRAWRTMGASRNDGDGELPAKPR
jgi:hypothetical protein